MDDVLRGCPRASGGRGQPCTPPNSYKRDASPPIDITVLGAIGRRLSGRRARLGARDAFTRLQSTVINRGDG